MQTLEMLLTAHLKSKVCRTVSPDIAGAGVVIYPQRVHTQSSQRLLAQESEAEIL